MLELKGPLESLTFVSSLYMWGNQTLGRDWAYVKSMLKPGLKEDLLAHNVLIFLFEHTLHSSSISSYDTFYIPFCFTISCNYLYL